MLSPIRLSTLLISQKLVVQVLSKILLNGQVKHAFIDSMHVASPSMFQWNRSSPQHVDGEALRKLFPVNFFTDFLAILRDPVDRFISAYLFQNERTFVYEQGY